MIKKGYFGGESTVEIDACIEDMANHTDCWPWYWLSYGEKCYAFAVVEAYPVDEHATFPKPGSQLIQDLDGNWCGVEGSTSEMIIDSTIAEIEEQRGDTVCKFIASAHANLMGDNLNI